MFQKYWDVCPSIERSLFKSSNRKGYSELIVSKSLIKETIFGHKEFKEFSNQSEALFKKWVKSTVNKLEKIDVGDHPKEIIFNISEALLGVFPEEGLIDKYDVFQHLMSYWEDVMQDDVYIITIDGWDSGKSFKRFVKVNNKKKEVEVKGLEGIDGVLIPPKLLIEKFFTNEKQSLEKIENDINELLINICSVIDENNGEDEIFEELESGKKPPKSFFKEKKKELSDEGTSDEIKLLNDLEKIVSKLNGKEKEKKERLNALEEGVLEKYPLLTTQEIKEIVLHSKWLGSISEMFTYELEKVSFSLSSKIHDLVERYEEKLSTLDELLLELENKNVKEGQVQQLLTGQFRLPRYSKNWDGKYVSSDLGQIPSDWEVKKFSECVLGGFSYGINAAAVPFNPNLKNYLRITDISDDGRYRPNPKVSVDSRHSSNYVLSENDIVFARTGASVGKSYLYREEDGELVYAGFLIKTKINPELINPYFLKFYTQSGKYWKWVKMTSVRSGQPGINGKEFSNMLIALPKNIDEQNEIGEILKSYDGVLELYEKKLKKLKNIKIGMTQKLLIGK